MRNKSKAYKLSSVVEDKVTNFLGYKPIRHFEDTETGLLRHLGSMERTTSVNQVDSHGRKQFDLLNEDAYLMIETTRCLYNGLQPICVNTSGNIWVY